MRILVATDAWFPQVNGVVRTLTSLAAGACSASASRSSFLTPEGIPTFALPSYPDIRLALPCRARDRARASTPSGPTPSISRPKARSASRRAGIASAHGAAVHDQLPHPLRRLCGGALADPDEPELGAGCAGSTMPAAAPWRRPPSLADELRRRGFRKLMRWPRGVDADLFRPRSGSDPRPAAAGLPHRRPARGREEHRGLPGARPAGHQGRGRRRAGARRAGARFPDGDLPRRQARRGAGRRLRRRRRVRVSRAAPTRSGWSCSRRSRAACRSPAFR